MRAPLSIVIPTLNAERELPACLAALTPGLEAGVIRELVISDGGSEDGTQSIAQAAGAAWVTGAAGRGGQLARGCRAAQGAWVLVLHADTQLTPGWVAPVLEHMAQHPDSAGYFHLEFRAEGLAPWLVAGWANLRSRWLGLPYGDQGLLIARAHYDRIGGYSDDPLMEDIEIVRRLGGALRPLEARARTSAARYQAQGWLRRGARNLWTLLRYRLGADPQDLAAFYRK